MLVIIYESSICTLSFCRSPLSSLISVIHYLGFLVTSYSLQLVNIFHIIVLKSLWLDKISLELSSRLVLRLCTISSCLLLFNYVKKDVSSCTSIRSLQHVLLINFNSETTFTYVSAVSSSRIFLWPVRRIPYPLIPAPYMNFPDHIHHFYFSPIDGIIWIFFSYILYLFVFSCQNFDQNSVLLVVL